MLKQVKTICQLYNIWPQRSKGQNFLINQEVLDKILVAANLSANDIVLEVGSGLGILTEALIRKAKKVFSVELDKKIFSFLQIKFKKAKNLDLINQDILKLRADGLGLETYKIVANIPYNITSIFLKKFLTEEPKPKRMVLLVQKEVGKRICAQPGEMSLLAISVQLYGKPKIISSVPKDNFWPQPEVDSVILEISEIKSSQQTENYLGQLSEKEFWQLVRIGFSAKRKQLANNLAAGLKISSLEAREAIVQANLEVKIRAQSLAVGDWLRLAKSLKIKLN